jgi:signal transduction histidine kinase
VSHELRTPLTIIQGYSELIVDGMLDDPDAIRQSAAEIQASSALMLRIVDDLLDLPRRAAGAVDLKPGSLDVSDWLARLVTGFGQAMPSHRLVLDVRDALPCITADPDRLCQVMHNLLSNALRYSPAGSPIVVSADVVGDWVEIKVTDQGAGIPAEECERIFEKFYRGTHGAAFGVRGMGLGLAVARQLTEAHGGRIGVNSTLGRGSTFWIRLPLPPSDVFSQAQAA